MHSGEYGDIKVVEVLTILSLFYYANLFGL